MKITKEQLRKLIKEEAQKLQEVERQGEHLSGEAGASVSDIENLVQEFCDSLEPLWKGMVGPEAEGNIDPREVERATMSLAVEMYELVEKIENKLVQGEFVR